ncbi:Hypothetical_protein [Hexamita inflata]|uniref:Hypothetical_protein n=1 Tax=Hexamita inflata TaxID=28002 RepID=A0AA86RH18_9EUKA|nr:Hypothetical protein HINF_LOCUS65526 [Hexamita inflata]
MEQQIKSQLLFQENTQANLNTKINNTYIALNQLSEEQKHIFSYLSENMQIVYDDSNKKCLILQYISSKWNDTNGQNVTDLAKCLYKLLDFNNDVLPKLLTTDNQNSQMVTGIKAITELNRIIIEIEAHLIIKQIEAKNKFQEEQYPDIQTLSPSQFLKTMAQFAIDNGSHLSENQLFEMQQKFNGKSQSQLSGDTKVLHEMYLQYSQVQEFKISSKQELQLNYPLSTIQYSYQNEVGQFVGFFQIWCKLRTYIIHQLTKQIRGIVKIYGGVKSGKTLTSLLSAVFLSLFLNKMQINTHIRSNQVCKIVFIDMSELVNKTTACLKLQQLAILISKQIAPKYLKKIESLLTKEQNSQIEYYKLEQIIQNMVNSESFCYHTIIFDEYQCLFSNLTEVERIQLAITFKMLTVKQLSFHPSTFIISGSTTIINAWSLNYCVSNGSSVYQGITLTTDYNSSQDDLSDMYIISQQNHGQFLHQYKDSLHSQLETIFKCVKCAHINILLSQLASDRSLNVENVVKQLYNQILQVFRADFQLFTNKIQSELIIQFCLRYAYGSTEIPSRYFNCKTFSEDHKLDYAIFITQNTIEGTITYKFMDQLFCDFVLFYDFATKNQQYYFLAACFSGLTNKHIYKIMNSQQYQTNYQEFQNYWSKAYNQCEQQYWTQIIEICAISDLEYKKKQLKMSNPTYNGNLNELVTNLKQNSVKVFILIRNILDHINDSYVSQERFSQVLKLLSKCFQNKMLKFFIIYSRFQMQNFQVQNIIVLIIWPTTHKQKNWRITLHKFIRHLRLTTN